MRSSSVIPLLPLAHSGVHGKTNHPKVRIDRKVAFPMENDRTLVGCPFAVFPVETAHGPVATMDTTTQVIGGSKALRSQS